jgi:nitronate monooxygenase
MRKRTAELRKGLRLPIIAAPMFLVSGPDLVVSACRAGIGAALPAPNARTLEQLDEWLTAIRRGVAGHDARGYPAGPWALNLVTHSSYDRLPAEMELLALHRPPLVITALGSPAAVVDAVHDYGGMVFADVSTLQFARKAAASGVDGLVLVCAGAGGHTGSISPFAFVPAVREFFDGAIALAGCIGTGAAVRAAEVLGADLAYVGTPFIVAEESLANADYRGMVTEATLDDLVLTPALTGANAYYLRQSIERAGLDPANLVGKTSVDLRDSQRQLKAWRDIWSAGQGVGTIHATEPAARIVEQLLDGYSRACDT